MLYETALIITVAFLLDCLIGDPQNPLHPIRLIGGGIALGIKIKPKNPKKRVLQFIAGMFLSLMIIALSYTAVRLLTWGVYGIDYWLGLTVEIIICYFLIAPRALRDESMKVYHALSPSNGGHPQTPENIEKARKNLSFIVGRDTENLNQPGIVKAAVETVAENLSDGVIAPLIFIAIGNAVLGVGAPLGMAYKAVNTLDSMIGYKNDEFEYFGKFAARLDDVVNFIPARISALLMIVGSLFTRADTKNALRIYARDRKNHKSPNSAHTEAVCAGALGIALGGDSRYRGKLVRKPTIGDPLNEPNPVGQDCTPLPPEHIVTANRLMYAATIIAVILLSAGSILLGAIRHV